MEAQRLIACKNRWTGETKQVPASELAFRPSAYGVLIKGDEVLLSPQRDGYDLPGGGIHKGERIEEGLLREYTEETGLTVDRGELLHVGEDFFIATIKPGGGYFHSLVYYYTVHNPRGEISTEQFEDYEKTYMRAAEWHPISALDTLKFYAPVDVPALVRKAIQVHV